jgi:hypothetical protein
MPVNRRTFLRTVSAVGGAVLTNGFLVACGGRARSINGDAVVNLLWSDVTSAYAPLDDRYTRLGAQCGHVQG